MKFTTLPPLLFLSTTASAALLHRAIPQDPSFPARVRHSTQKAHIARSPSPQGPPSNPGQPILDRGSRAGFPNMKPGEFIDPGLSHANPRNNPPPPLQSATYAASGPSAANYEYASISLPVLTPTVSAAAASSPTPDMSNMSNMNMNKMMNSTDPNTDNSTMPDMPDPTDPNIDTSTTTTSTMDPGMGMGIDNSTSAYPHYPSRHHHNHTHTWNGTLYYNTTDNAVYVDTVYPNGTETIAIVSQNTTDSPYPYENGTHHHHHQHHGNRTQDYGGPTPTGYAVLPGQTGRGPERLGGAVGGGVGVGFKPGFTGPKVRREGKGMGRRWLSGVW